MQSSTGYESQSSRSWEMRRTRIQWWTVVGVLWLHSLSLSHSFSSVSKNWHRRRRQATGSVVAQLTETKSHGSSFFFQNHHYHHDRLLVGFLQSHKTSGWIGPPPHHHHRHHSRRLEQPNEVMTRAAIPVSTVDDTTGNNNLPSLSSKFTSRKTGSLWKTKTAVLQDVVRRLRIERDQMQTQIRQLEEETNHNQSLLKPDDHDHDDTVQRWNWLRTWIPHWKAQQYKQCQEWIATSNKALEWNTILVQPLQEQSAAQAQVIHHLQQELLLLEQQEEQQLPHESTEEEKSPLVENDAMVHHQNEMAALQQKRRELQQAVALQLEQLAQQQQEEQQRQEQEVLFQQQLELAERRHKRKLQQLEEELHESQQAARQAVQTAEERERSAIASWQTAQQQIMLHQQELQTLRQQRHDREQERKREQQQQQPQQEPLQQSFQPPTEPDVIEPQALQTETVTESQSFHPPSPSKMDTMDDDTPAWLSVYQRFLYQRLFRRRSKLVAQLCPSSTLFGTGHYNPKTDRLFALLALLALQLVPRPRLVTQLLSSTLSEENEEEDDDDDIWINPEDDEKDEEYHNVVAAGI